MFVFLPYFVFFFTWLLQILSKRSWRRVSTICTLLHALFISSAFSNFNSCSIFFDLVTRCLEIDPKNRVGAKQALEHDFFRHWFLSIPVVDYTPFASHHIHFCMIRFWLVLTDCLWRTLQGYRPLLQQSSWRPEARLGRCDDAKNDITHEFIARAPFITVVGLRKHN